MKEVDPALLNKLPSWCHNNVIELSLFKTGRDANYHAILKPLDGDMNKEDVTFNADSLQELKWELIQYRKNFSRYGIDY